jgi:hypothetical protein
MERYGYSQVFTVDRNRPMQAILLQIAEEARIPNPSAWILCSMMEEVVSESRYLMDGQTYRLKSTVRIEFEGKTKCFNISEGEDGLTLHLRIHRGLGTDMEHWEILDSQGTAVEPGSKSLAGSLNFMVEKSEQDRDRQGPKLVQITHRWNRITIPVQEKDSMATVLLLVETIMKLRERWELRNETDQVMEHVMEHVTQFRHRGVCRVHLINERRERSRTIIKREPGEVRAQDYLKILDLPVKTAADPTSDPGELREMSCRRKSGRRDQKVQQRK